MQPSESFYRQISGEGASYIGLLLAVYDTLAGDFGRAAAAVAQGDIGARCDATNHALLLLGHLESWTDTLDDSTLQNSLRQFYLYLRSRAVALQAQSAPADWHELARLVSETRAAWQTRQAQHLAAAPPAAPRFAFGSVEDDGPAERHSWSA